MNDSILTSIKQMLGIAEDYDAFNTDVIIHINTAFMLLNQLGVGPKEGFSISSAAQKWSDFLTTTIPLEATKTYVYLKVRLVFDPPTSAFVLESLDRTCKELEWRLEVQAEGGTASG